MWNKIKAIRERITEIWKKNDGETDFWVHFDDETDLHFLIEYFDEDNGDEREEYHVYAYQILKDHLQRDFVDTSFGIEIF